MRIAQHHFKHCDRACFILVAQLRLNLGLNEGPKPDSNYADNQIR